MSHSAFDSGVLGVCAWATSAGHRLGFVHGFGDHGGSQATYRAEVPGDAAVQLVVVAYPDFWAAHHSDSTETGLGHPAMGASAVVSPLGDILVPESRVSRCGSAIKAS